MSWKRGNIAEGDIVIAYAGKDRISAVKVKRGQVYQTKYGAFPHNDMIGKPYGSKIYNKDKSWICLLSPTPELYTAGALEHRTQIIYTTDIAMITFHLELKPGSVVVESGTGSGSVSRAIARTIAPNGHLYTFEFHEQRASLAVESFKESGLAGLITLRHRDVCQEAFDLPAASVDAVLLDLPSPWLAIPHAAHVLKHYGMLCTYSPCIEQVQRGCEAMRAHGFTDLRTIECLLRPYDLRPLRLETTRAPAPSSKKRRADEAATEKSKEADKEDAEQEEVEEKEEKEEKEEEASNGEQVPTAATGEMKEKEGSMEVEKVPKSEKAEAPAEGRAGKRKQPPETRMLLLPSADIRGHTAYLTFARRLIPPA